MTTPVTTLERWPTPDTLRGLDEADAVRPAFAILAEVSWEGPRLDPQELSAFELLALL